MAVLALGQVELRQNVAHVRLDRALAQVEALGDAHIRKALGHQLELKGANIGVASWEDRRHGLLLPLSRRPGSAGRTRS